MDQTYPINRREKPIGHQSEVSVTLWGMFLPTGDLQCLEMQGNLKTTKYIRILKDNLLPKMKSLYGDDWLLQQDNASSHTSKSSNS